MTAGELDLVRLVSPLIVGILAFSMPRIVRAAINGKFAQFRNEQVERMAAHNRDEEAHPNLLRIADLHNELKTGLAELGARFQDLHDAFIEHDTWERSRFDKWLEPPPKLIVPSRKRKR